MIDTGHGADVEISFIQKHVCICILFYKFETREIIWHPLNDTPPKFCFVDTLRLQSVYILSEDDTFMTQNIEI